MTEYLLGIDNGNTISKAAIFDLQGHEIQVSSRQVESVFPHTGWTERDMDTLWQNTAMTIKEALSTSRIKPERIIGCRWLEPSGLACAGLSLHHPSLLARAAEFPAGLD
jgi:sugar (pentulose or hexulose) kinase